MKRFLTWFLLAFTFSAISVMAADATGKWVGNLSLKSPEGEEQTRPAHLVLKQEGATITGTAGPDANEQHPISGGKIEGDRITFEVPENSMKFNLKIEGDQITGEITRERNGETRRAQITVKRQS